MKSKSPKIETNNHDDFLYYALIDLLKQIKLTRGANEVGFTLRNHPFLRDYLVSKQISKINFLEQTYFDESGLLLFNVIEDRYLKLKSLQSK